MVGEAAWAYQRRPWGGGFLRKRQQGLDQEVKDIGVEGADTAALALHQADRQRDEQQSDRGRSRSRVLGFIWAIATRTEAKFQKQAA